MHTSLKSDDFQPSNAREASRPLSFMHVPKAAGTSMMAALVDATGATRAPWQFDRFHFGGQPRLDEMSTEAQALILLDGTAPAGTLIAGHISLSSIRRACPGGQVVTLLREPVSRLLSLCAFNARVPAEAFPPWGPDWEARIALARQPLADYLREPRAAALTDNVVTRYLLQPQARIPDDDFLHPDDAPALLAAALQALAGIDLVDVIENPGLPDRLGTWLGRPVVFGRLNEALPPPTSLATVIDGARDAASDSLLAQRTCIDDAIWRAVVAARMGGCDVDELAAKQQADQRRRLRALSRAA